MDKTLKIIRYLIIGGIFLIPFLPLVVTSSLFFPFITGKNFLFRILIELIFALWIILAVNDRMYRPKKSLILIFLSAFVFLAFLSSVFGENPYRSFWSNYERMEGLVTYLHLFAYFLVLISVFRLERLWKWFFHISLVASAIISIYALLQFAGNLEIHQSANRLDATLGNASYLAIYMVFHIFLALWYFSKEKNWYKWFYSALAVLYSIILYNTATRGAILGLVGGLLLCTLLLALFSQSRKIKMFAISSLVLILILLGIFWIFRTSNFVTQNPVLSRFSNISLEETTTQSRLVIWRMSWEGFKEKPILGWGPENYNLVFNKYYEPILWKQELWFDRAHNVFFDRLTTGGILGLFSYLGLFASVLYYLLLKRRQFGFSAYDSSILISLFAAYFFHNLFVFDNLTSFILFFAFLGYVHNRSTTSLAPDSIKPKKDRFAISSAFVLVAVVFVIYFINIPAFLASRNLLGALRSAAGGNLEESLVKFEKSISYDSFGTPETREHFTNFAMRVIQGQDIDENFKNKVFESASSEMKKQIDNAPNDIRYMLFLGVLYNKAGQYDEAINILQKAINLSPKKQALYFELATSYLNRKEYEKGLKVTRIAFELDTSFGDARKIYAAIAIYAGKIDLAEKILSEEYGTHIVADTRLVNAYNSIGESDKVVQIWEKFIEENPNNVQYRISLAASYLLIEEREKSIEQLEKAIEIEPAFKDRGEYYINEIRAGRNP